MKIFKYIIIGIIVIMLSACSSKSGSSTPTPDATQAVITKVADFINGGTAPTLAEYTDAGVTGVTAQNIDELNTLIASKTSTEVDTIAKIQAIVTLLGASSDTNTTQVVITKVADFINGVGIAPNVEDYTNLGISGVTAQNINQINSTILGKTTGEVDTISKIEAIVNTILNPTDTTSPIIILNGDSAITITQGSSYIDQKAVVTDNVDVTRTISSLDSVNTNIVATYTLRYDANDSAGNRATEVTRVVNVVSPNSTDTIKPRIVLNGNTIITIYQGNTYTDLGAVVTDNIDANRNISSLDSVNTAVVGSYTLRYDANDSAGNSAIEVTRVVKVVDITTPTIIIRDDTNTTEYGSIYTDKGAIALDGAGNFITVITTGTDFNTSKLGEHNITYTATNASGIKSIKIRTVRVVDTTPPRITINGDINITIAQGSNYIEYGASISDNVDSGLSLVISGEVNISKVGTYTISYNTTDSAGNRADEQNRTVNVTDQTAPVITIDGNVTYYVDYNTTYTDEGASFTDNVDANSHISAFDDVNVTQLGSYTITYNATDTAGHSAIPKIRTVIVVDRVSPTIDIIGGADINISYSNIEQYGDANATIADNVDSLENIFIKITDTVARDIIGVYSVTYFARDKSDNNTTKVRTVRVIDDTPPVITLIGDATINLVQGDSYIEYNATADDDLDGDINSSIVISGTVDNNTIGTYTISYNVTDSAGNSAIEVNRTIVVALNNAPTITAKDKNLIEGDKIDTNSSGIDVNASDIDGNISMYYFKEGNSTLYQGASLPTTLSALSFGEHSISITVTDNHELNSTEANITVMVSLGQINIKKTEANTSLSGVKYDDNYYRAGVSWSYNKDTYNNIIDAQSELLWEDNVTSASQKIYETRGNDYTKYCKDLAGVGSDIWRIPTRRELLSLVHYGDGTTPFIDANFTNTQANHYWSYTQDINNVNNYWYIDFSTGGEQRYDFNNTKYIRCVRDTNTTPKVTDANFTTEGVIDTNHTVIDHNTMLEWQDNNISADMNWTQALNYCHDMNLSENGIDWRLPNINELASIIDDTKASHAIDGNFTQTSLNFYWSSTYLYNSVAVAYAINFSSGELDSKNITINTHKVRCVRTRREPSFYQ